MKTSSSDLFLLIQSMTKSEKGYFKKMARGDKNYVLLFNEIEKQLLSKKGYDEDELKIIFKDEKFVKQFSVNKNYLYRQLLKILGQYREAKSEKKELYETMESIDILISKGLYSQADKILLKAKKKADEWESYDIMLGLLNLELNIIRRLYTSVSEKGTVTKLEARINRVHKEEKAVIAKLENINFYRWHYERAGVIFNRGLYVRNKKDIEKYETIIKEIHLPSETMLDSVKSRSFYYSTLIPYYSILGNYKKSYEYDKKLYFCIERSKLRTGVWRYNHLVSLQNLVQSAGVLGKIKEAEEYSERFKKSLANPNIKLSDINRFRLTGRNLANDFMMYVHWNLLDKASLKLKEIEQILMPALDRMRTPDRILLEYYIARYYFTVADYSQAVKWTTNIINLKEHDKMLDLFSHARVLHLLIHFELKDYSLVDYILKSSERYLKRKDEFYKVEEMIFKFLRDAIKTSNESDTDLFYRLFRELKIILRAGNSNVSLMYFDYVSWAESKVQNKPLIEILKRKKV